MPTEYEKGWARYRELAAKSQAGDKQARAEKAKVRGELREIEREAARKGEVLNPVLERGNIVAQITETNSRRSLQEEYIRKFPGPDENGQEPRVMLAPRAGEQPEETTLRKWHRKRLLGK